MPPRGRGNTPGASVRGGPPTPGSRRRRGRRGRGGSRGGDRNAGRGDVDSGDEPAPGSPHGSGGGGDSSAGPLSTTSHVQTVGARRPGHGHRGKQIEVNTNHFAVTTPKSTIHHYDVISSALGITYYPTRLNMEIIIKLQNDNPEVFTPMAVYDGRSNLFSPQALIFRNAAEFQVNIDNTSTYFSQPTYQVRLTKVAEINPEALARYLDGQQSIEKVILTTITALNIIIRMGTSLRYPYNGRSIFTPEETKDIGMGIVLWRGYFQSARPAVGRMLVNVDISTGAMHKPGNVLDICLQLLGLRRDNISAMHVGNLSPRDALKLSRFLAGVRVISNVDHTRPPRTIRRIMDQENASMTFTLNQAGQPPLITTIANYFRGTFRRRVTRPNVVLAQIGNQGYVPLEFLEILPGQIMRKQVPSTKTKDVLDFAMKRPNERLKIIRDGLQMLNYWQSEYMHDFGMRVDENPLTLNARVLVPPTLRYGAGSKRPTIRPRDGTWNMIDKKFMVPGRISAWAVVIYERQQRFNQQNVADLLQGMRGCAKDVGIAGFETNPVISWENGQGVIADQLRNAGMKCKQATGQLPSIIVCILPEGATDIYNAIKHFGDISAGVATQCLKSSKCFRAKAQYYANVMLKVNVKLGGVNVVPDAKDVPFLSNATQPVLVLGGKAIHPPPGAEGRPSFSAVVGNVDGNVSKYIATSRVQTSRKEMIEDMCEMTKYILQMYDKFRTNVEKKPGYPKRVVFYRGGVSEGQFNTVLNEEVPEIKRAFGELGISPPLTFIIVGKRHHVRMFPRSHGSADRSGNCPSGTVIDTDIVHPTDFDFYLQSHGGLHGTSRPCHYSILLDENQFTADAVQQLSFSLCHVYARSTCAVSFPSPIYYADVVCSRARTHYDPQAQHQLHFAEDDNDTSGTSHIDRYKAGFKALHPMTAPNMYFM